MAFAEQGHDDLSLLLKQAQALESAGQFAQSHLLLQRCDALCDRTVNADLIRAVRSGLWRLAPLWWAELKHGGVGLRRCHRDDADFFRTCFGDSSFQRQFNRRQPWRGDLAAALDNSGRLPPLRTGLLMWVIESKTSGRVGLASLSSIDTFNRRAEFSIGFPGEVPATLGAKVSLMALHFALVLMPLNKVYAYVYEDNTKALSDALRLGFVQEGMLRDHFNINGEGFVSVHQIGLTRAQIHSSERLKTLARRKIGQAW